MSDIFKKTINILKRSALVLGLLVISALAVMYGWKLFAVPVFGLAKLTFSQAFGLVMIAGFLPRGGSSS